MQIVILDAKTLGEDLDLSALEALGTITRYETTDPSQTYSRIEHAQIVITNKVVINAQMMASLPNLQLICVAATGMNNIDLEAAKAHGISVKNVKGYSTTSVVQHTFSMALYLLEQLAYYDRSVKTMQWTESGIFTDLSRPFYEIAGKKWGVIGFGTIGQKVADLATAFGAEVCYYSTSGENRLQLCPHHDLESLMKHCDLISIHAPLNDQTANLIHAGNLCLLKEGAILLNLGRGGIINEHDLAQALDQQRLYVGLDVLEHEPMQENNPLRTIAHPERLLITPHIAWASIEARQKLLAGIVENIKTFLEQ